MSILADHPAVCKNQPPPVVPLPAPVTSVADAWRAAARALSCWTFAHLVNRFDASGGHREDGSRFTAKKPLRLKQLETHFSGRRIIGLHTISTHDTSKWTLFDIDAHDDGDTTATATANFAIALEICRRAIALGLHPILSDSNGKGGYHVQVIFSRPIPATDAYHFGLWLARGHNPNKSGGSGVKRVPPGIRQSWAAASGQNAAIAGFPPRSCHGIQ